MSENILIGKNRKTGKWELLCDPAESYDAHNRIYRKFSTNLPVNDDYSKVLFGRIQNTNTPLTLITSEEKATRDKAFSTVVQSATNAGKDAAEREARRTTDLAAVELESRKKLLDEKNALVNKIRRETNQEPHEVTAQEILENELQKKLAKSAIPAPVLETTDKAITEATKLTAEQLEEKNKLVEQLKAQSDDLQQQRNQAQAGGSGEAATPAKPAPKNNPKIT